MLNRIIVLLLVLALLFGGYALWDTWQVFSAAGTDLRYKPQLRTDGSTDPSFSELIDLNPDVKAWLTIDGTGIDYPVVQGKDNMKYVNCSVYGSYSLSGSIFIDYRCAPDFSDNYTVVYGHHMDGGTMFGDLLKYEDKSFFNAHLTGTLILPGKGYKLEVFAYMHVDAYDEMFNTGVQGSAFAARLRHIREEAVHYRDVGLTVQDRVVVLSTCSSASTNGRGIAVAKICEVS